MKKLKKIKILYFVPTLEVGGILRYLFELVANLNKDKFEVIIWCAFALGHYEDKLRASGIKVMQRCFKRYRWDIFGVIKTIYLIRKENVDIIHSHLYPWTFWDAVIGKLSGVPIIITSRHGLRYLEKNYFFYCRIRNYFTDRVVACSNAVKETVLKAEGIGPDKIEVIYHAIDFKNIPKEVDTIIIKKELGLNSADNIVGTIGRLRSVKGFQYFLKAASIIVKSTNNVKFVIVGQGGREEQLKIMSEKLGLDKYMIFTGLRTDVFEMLATFDIFVLSSLSEAFAVVLLEAAAMGKPIVATRCGGPAEIIEDGRTGYLVPSADEKSLADAIIKLLKDKKRAIRFGEAGRDLVREKFGLEKMTKEYTEFYRSLYNHT